MAGFSAEKLVWSIDLSATTKLTSGDETPPISNLQNVSGQAKRRYDNANNINVGGVADKF
jgi:hypothetical protein